MSQYCDKTAVTFCPIKVKIWSRVTVWQLVWRQDIYKLFITWTFHQQAYVRSRCSTLLTKLTITLLVSKQYIKWPSHCTCRYTNKLTLLAAASLTTNHDPLCCSDSSLYSRAQNNWSTKNITSADTNQETSKSPEWESQYQVYSKTKEAIHSIKLMHRSLLYSINFAKHTLIILYSHNDQMHVTWK